MCVVGVTATATAAFFDPGTAGRISTPGGSVRGAAGDPARGFLYAADNQASEFRSQF
jgi:hypothetical protein